jgi:hypothetical protein
MSKYFRENESKGDARNQREEKAKENVKKERVVG